MPLNLFAHHCLLDHLQHVLAPIAHFCLAKLILLEAFQLNAIFLELCLFVIIPFFVDKDVVFQSVLYFLVDIEIVDPALNEFCHFGVQLLFVFAILKVTGKSTFLASAIFLLSYLSSSERPYTILWLFWI